VRLGFAGDETRKATWQAVAEALGDRQARRPDRTRPGGRFLGLAGAYQAFRVGSGSSMEELPRGDSTRLLRPTSNRHGLAMT